MSHKVSIRNFGEVALAAYRGDGSVEVIPPGARVVVDLAAGGDLTVKTELPAQEEKSILDQAKENFPGVEKKKTTRKKKG